MLYERNAELYERRTVYDATVYYDSGDAVRNASPEGRHANFGVRKGRATKWFLIGGGGGHNLTLGLLCDCPAFPVQQHCSGKYRRRCATNAPPEQTLCPNTSMLYTQGIFQTRKTGVIKVP